jgi:hypothetical protein
MSQQPDRSDCAQLADDLAALAVGALSGRERMAVLAHVENCPSCAVELESLAAGGDALLALYPEIEPDDGFTERVTARLGVDEKPVRHRRPSRVLMAAAAAVVVLALAGASIAVLSGGNGGNAGSGATATLQSPSGPKGKVVLTSGHGDWMVMSLDDAVGAGVVSCRVTYSDGTTRTVGHFAVHAGYGNWSVRLPVPPSEVEAVSVVNQHGTVIATASL